MPVSDWARGDIEKRRRQRRESYHRNKERSLARTKAWCQKYKDEVFTHYGNKCACCGEDFPPFLAIDHVNGDGAVQRKQVNWGGRKNYRWVVLAGFPTDLQILCHNCNIAKGRGKECPCKNRALSSTL